MPLIYPESDISTFSQSFDRVQQGRSSRLVFHAGPQKMIHVVESQPAATYLRVDQSYTLEMCTFLSALAFLGTNKIGLLHSDCVASIDLFYNILRIWLSTSSFCAYGNLYGFEYIGIVLFFIFEYAS